MVALLIGLWILIFAPLALAPFFLTGDIGDLIEDVLFDQSREVARLAHMQPLHRHNRAA